MIERLVFTAPFWIVALAFVSLKWHYARRNLGLVALGSGLFLTAAAADPEAGVWIGLAAIGGSLWLRGVDAERDKATVLGEG